MQGHTVLAHRFLADSKQLNSQKATSNAALAISDLCLPLTQNILFLKLIVFFTSREINVLLGEA